MFHALFAGGHYFVQYGFRQISSFYRMFWKTSFFVFLHFLRCVEFDVTFINFVTFALQNRCLYSSY